jgi:hypothetical protein
MLFLDLSPNADERNCNSRMMLHNDEETLMKTQLMKHGRKWSLYSAVLAAMAYSALSLTSQPAYAGTCTPARCNTLHNFCVVLCGMHGGLAIYECPAPKFPNTAACICHDTSIFPLSC